MKDRLFPRSVRAAQRSIDQMFDGDRHVWGMVRRKRLSLVLEREANRHSVELEYPGLHGSSKREILREAQQRQQRAWDYALENIGRTLSYSPRDLAVIASMLVPCQRINYSTGFRVDDVMITGASHSPPSASKVPGEMQRLMGAVALFETPLEKAIYSHFHIARIHPFMDGNGRLSRVVQNSLLTGGGYFPMIISIDARSHYIDVLDKGVRDFNNGSRDYLRRFSEFIVERFAASVNYFARSERRPWYLTGHRRPK